MAVAPRLLVLPALVSIALAASCGDDDEQATPPTTGAPAATGTTTDEPAESRSCGDVGFTPNTDAGAFEIVASGVDCETARRVAAAAEGEGRRFSARGFECRGIRREGALPTVEFTCRRDGQRIRFSAS